MDNSVSRLLTAREAASYLGLSRRTVWKWAADGRLPVTRLGRKVLFDRLQLDALIDHHTTRSDA